MSSYQQFIQSTLASKTTEAKVNQLISNHTDVTSKANQLDVVESLAEIVVTTEDPKDTSKKIIDPNGNGILNTFQTQLSDIQTQLSDIFERLVTLEESAGSTPVVEPTEDTTAPVITLVDDSSMTIEVGSTYVEPGATATDNVDGDLTQSIDIGGNVDTSTVGDYTITYNVTDSSGNAATQVTRTVSVVDTTTLVSPNQSFTWANDGVVNLGKLQEEYTQDFKSNNVNKTLVFVTSSFNVSLNDSVDIHNVDTSTMLSPGDVYDIKINTTDFKFKIDRVYGDTSILPNNIIVRDPGFFFTGYDVSIQNDQYTKIHFGESWVLNFYRILGASYNANSISSNNFTITNNTGSYVEVDYILHHKSNSDQDITLTFQVENTGQVNNNIVKHDAFTFDNNYYTFDTNGDFKLNDMTFSEARQYITSNWNYENLQATSTDVNEYGVTVASTNSWNLRFGILDDDSFIEFNSELEGTTVYSSINLSGQMSSGLKVKEGVTTKSIEGYILNKNDFTIYDSGETTSDVYLDFTFDQINLSDSRKLTAVIQEFLPSSGFKLNSGSVTLDPTITYKIDDVDVTNQEIIIDDLTEITANEFLVAI